MENEIGEREEEGERENGGGHIVEGANGRAGRERMEKDGDSLMMNHGESPLE